MLGARKTLVDVKKGQFALGKHDFKEPEKGLTLEGMKSDESLKQQFYKWKKHEFPE